MQILVSIWMCDVRILSCPTARELWNCWTSCWFPCWSYARAAWDFHTCTARQQTQNFITTFFLKYMMFTLVQGDKQINAFFELTNFKNHLTCRY
jgi:hypothetical protein